MVEAIGKITKIKEETYDVKTFRLKLPKRINFIPGQYCLVSFIDKKKFESDPRPFTFTNSPTEEGDFIELTIKKMGEFTTTLHNLKKGAKLKIDGPYGEALNFNNSIKDDIVFLAGGSGITPFISAIRYAIAKNLPNKMFLFFSNRTERDIIYEKELKRINKETNNIKIIHTLTNGWPEDWDGETGRINREMIEKYVKNPKEKLLLWYICGPPPMVEAMKNILVEEMGIPKDRLRVEAWQLPGKA